MPQPDLRMLAQWLDPVLVAMLENRRRLNNEWRRHRKLATLETLWLMLAVSLDTHRFGLYEILSLATAELGIQWTISVPAFCKARARFSPGRSLLAAWHTGIKAAKNLQRRAHPLEGIAAACRRQDNSGITRISISLEMLRRTQGLAGIGAGCRGALLPV
jgi:hypothetical protein